MFDNKPGYIPAEIVEGYLALRWPTPTRGSKVTVEPVHRETRDGYLILRARLHPHRSDCEIIVGEVPFRRRSWVGTEHIYVVCLHNPSTGATWRHDFNKTIEEASAKWERYDDVPDHLHHLPEPDDEPWGYAG